MPTPLDVMLAWVPEHGKQQSKASEKLTDAMNTSKPGLKSHQTVRDLAEASAASESWSLTLAVKHKQLLAAYAFLMMSRMILNIMMTIYMFFQKVLFFFFFIELKCFFLSFSF